MKTYERITREELPSLLAAWQTRLRMTEWTMRAEVVGSNEMGPARRGEMSSEVKIKDAVISLLSPAEFNYDMEVVLVHEMLHAKFAFCDRFIIKNPLAEDEMEFAIESLALALVAGYRVYT